MTPDHALRLTTLIRAMQEVILPAIDAQQRLALDQAQIVIGNLRILLDQCDKCYQYEMVELREYHQLVQALTQVAAGGDETGRELAAAQAALQASAPVARLEIPSQAQLATLVRTLKTAADQLLRAAYLDGKPAYRAAADQLVHAQAAQQLTRERVWLRQAKFELAPERLPSLDSVLSLRRDPHV
jgi:hypothetical protein